MAWGVILRRRGSLGARKGGVRVSYSCVVVSSGLATRIQPETAGCAEKHWAKWPMVDRAEGSFVGTNANGDPRRMDGTCGRTSGRGHYRVTGGG